MGLTLVFEIKLDSDYHISAGHGLGAGVDSALLRDADGVPVLRGTTLAGLLRDGLWRLLRLKPLSKYQGCKASGKAEGDEYCGQHHWEQDDCPLCRLFGTPRHPKRWRIGSARPVGLDRPAETKWKAGAEGAQVVQRVRVSPRTRRAEPRKLFSQEDGDARLTFCFRASCPASGQDVLDEAALLVAAARNVRQLGRSRRRGQGECLFTLIEVKGLDAGGPQEGQSPQDWLLARFESNWLKGPPAKRAIQATPFTMPADEPRADQPVRVRLIVRTDEPLLIAKRAEAGNQFETMPLIAGQTVRGALAWLAAQRHGLSHELGTEPSEVYEAFLDVFLRQAVQFSVLYPTYITGAAISPTIPAPRNWLTCKTFPGLENTGHGLFGGLADSPDYCPNPKCGAPLRPLEGFVALNAAPVLWRDRVFVVKPKSRSELHIRVNPESGRVVEGDLFGYVTLEAGQFFVGELTCRNEVVWEKLKTLTGLIEKEPVPLRLGKAVRRGHGRVTAWLERLPEDALLTWIPQPIEQRVMNPNQIVLTLLTDTIVTDVWGRFPLGFEDNWLTDALGLKVEIVQGTASARTRPIDSFNAHLSLPRWRDMALEAGSAVRLKVISPPTDWQQRLRAIEEQGIGLRREEGFGRVAFNHPVYAQCKGIAESNIWLDPQMRLHGGEHAIDAENAFRTEWAKKLDGKDWAVFAIPKLAQSYTALARWLHAHQGVPPADLQGRLGSLGEPDDTLKSAIGEYGDRSKDNKLKGTPGLKLVDTLLGELAREEATCWPMGIVMLAERVAGAVEQKGGK